MLKRRRQTGAPPHARVVALLDLVATFRLLPTPVAVGFSPMGRATTYNALNWMVREKLLRRYTFSSAYSPQLRRTAAFHLTPKAVKLYESVSWCTARFVATPTDAIALWAFHRASLFLALHRDGFSVGRSSEHLLGLRRFVVDSQRKVVASLDGAAKVAAERTLKELRHDEDLLPPTQIACRACGSKSEIAKTPKRPCRCPRENSARDVIEHRMHCNACGMFSYGLDAAGCCKAPRLRRTDTVPFDIAVHPRPPDGLPAAAIILVDLPDSSIAKKLKALPLRIRGQPKVPVVLRPSESETIFDLSANRYLMKGRRFRLLTKAFTPDMDRSVSQFPYFMTAKVLNYRPDIGQRTA